MTATVRTVLLVTLVPLLAAAAAIVTLLAAAPGLPAELAAHWGVEGVDRVDGIGGLILLIAVLVATFTVFMTAAAVLALRRGTTRSYLRLLVALNSWFAVLISGGIVGSALAQRGVEDVRSLGAETALLPLLGAGLLGAVLALGVAALVPVVPGPVRGTPAAASLSLGAGESAYWSASVMSPRGVIALVVGVTVFVVVIMTVAGLPLWASVAVFVVMAAASSLLGWHVVVDRRGLRATGLYGFPRVSVPLDRVESAAPVEVEAVGQFGGWGMRVDRLGRRGLIVRSGEAIEVARVGRAPLVITVPDAATGAALLTALSTR